jgi:hypothetical protein
MNLIFLISIRRVFESLLFQACFEFRGGALQPLPAARSKSPNTFLLHASDTVEVEVHASGQLVPAGPQR